MEELFEAGVGEEDPFDDYRNILYPSSIENLTEEQKLEGRIVSFNNTSLLLICKFFIVS